MVVVVDVVVLLGVLLVEVVLFVDVCGGFGVLEAFAGLGWSVVVLVLLGLFTSFGFGAPDVLELEVAALPVMAPVVPVLLAAPALQLVESICRLPTFRLLSPELVPEMETSCPT